ncbi:MAG: 4-oxalomesaconate tautomerase [Hyphomicrobiales bacterium]
MTQTPIPCVFMRGGTSRGPYFNRADLPDDRSKLAEVLIAAVGAGHPLNIDGIGGGAAVTTKVAMLSPSEKEDVDVDYFFAQVSVEEREVDFSPTCGNILAGVGPAALEMGIVEPTGNKTEVRIHSVNTGADVTAVVETPNGAVKYEGDARIDGVPGTAAPITLNFKNVAGSRTGAMFPTQSPLETIQGVDVTLIDVAMPMCIARAEDFGLTGYETQAELDANKALFEKFEPIRIEAGERMGLGDVTKSVVPKFAVLAPAKNDGSVCARYFMPWKCHPSMAATGGICIASCVSAPGTIAANIADPSERGPIAITIEHPMGQMEINLAFDNDGGQFNLHSAGVLRTARKVMEGNLFIPSSVWQG